MPTPGSARQHHSVGGNYSAEKRKPNYYSSAAGSGNHNPPLQSPNGSTTQFTRVPNNLESRYQKKQEKLTAAARARSLDPPVRLF